MFCAKCGANVEQGKAFCSACGQPALGYTVGQTAAGAPSVASDLPMAVQSNVTYAGFWLRLVAAIIDGIVVSIPLAPIFLWVFVDVARHAQEFGGRQDPGAIITLMGPKIGLILFVTALLSWLYWSLCESSVWQATLGKKALGIVVTDLEGRRISFGRASGRFWVGRGVGSVIPYLGSTYFFVDCVCGIHGEETGDP